MSNKKDLIRNLKIGMKVYSVQHDRVIEKEVVKGENNDTGLALKWFVCKEELDSSWDWSDCIYLTKDEAEYALKKQIDQWAEQFSSKHSIIQFLFDLTVNASISKKKREKLKEIIEKELGIVVDLDNFN
jgi:hypothetical protein